ncbi:MAG: hypothetical protein M9932_11975 [Xanthobacteraceae bacterium]|nr:hypothetical protein [Xanthobacteraceae bacterium]
MTTITKTGFRLLAGCCLALLVAAGGGAAPAYGGWHHGGSGGGGPFGTGPVHGAGSSHDPIIQHPRLGPGASLHPVAVPGPVVRDHRRPSPAGDCQNNWYSPNCANEVHDHRRPQPRGDSRLTYCRHHWNASGCPKMVRDHRT